MSPELAEQNTGPESPVVQMPGVIELFTEGWEFARTNLPLVAILSTPFVLIEILTYMNIIQPSTSLQIAVGVVSFIAVIVYLLLVGAALYMVGHTSESATFTQGFSWAKTHFWSLLWLSALTGAIIWGGFILLIIPGIIISIYIVLSQMALVLEGKTGLSALLRSRELVYGNWWPVFGRILGTQLIFFGLMLLFALIAGSVAALIVDETSAEFVNNVLLNILGSVGTLILLSVTLRIYSVLSVQAVIQPEPVPSAKTKYQVLGWIGVVTVVLSVVAMVTFVDVNDSVVAEDTTNSLISLSYAQGEAQQYYVSQPQMTYVGVCAEIGQYLSDKGEVVCNESNSAYALLLQTPIAQYCVDSTGYKKIVYTDLAERTQCLDI